MNMLNEKDIVAVQSAIDDMVAALEAGDIDKVMSCYEQGAIVVASPDQVVSGDQMRAMFEQIMQMTPVFTFEKHEVLVTGDIATHTANWRFKATLPDGNTLEEGGLTMVVLRRQSNGKWLFVIDNPMVGQLQ